MTIDMTTTTGGATKPRKKPTLRYKTGADVKALRAKLRLNQTDFWSRINVTQSGGSRYESGPAIPQTVRLLLHLAYGTDKQTAELLTVLRDH